MEKNEYYDFLQIWNMLISRLVIFFLSISAFYVGTSCLISIKKVDDYLKSKKIEASINDTDNTPVIYDGIVFPNIKEMINFIEDEKYSLVSIYFDWSSIIPDFVLLIIGACSFGMLGSIMKILYDHTFKIILLENSNYFSLPLLGFLSGMLSISVSYLLPNIFLESESLTNPVGLTLFSLFFGFFIKEFLEKINEKLNNQKNEN